MAEQEVMVRAGGAECDQIPLVELEIRATEDHAVMEREDVVHLLSRSSMGTRTACDAMRLALQVSLLDGFPARAPCDLVPRGDESSMISHRTSPFALGAARRPSSGHG